MNGLFLLPRAFPQQPTDPPRAQLALESIFQTEVTGTPASIQSEAVSRTMCRQACGMVLFEHRGVSGLTHHIILKAIIKPASAPHTHTLWGFLKELPTGLMHKYRNLAMHLACIYVMSPTTVFGSSTSWSLALDFPSPPSFSHFLLCLAFKLPRIPQASWLLCPS